MKSVVKSAKTIEEAIEAALLELNADLDDSIVTILERPKAGFLGVIGQKDAVVKVELKEDTDVSDFVEEALDRSKKDNIEKKDDLVKANEKLDQEKKKEKVNIEEKQKKKKEEVNEHVYIANSFKDKEEVKEKKIEVIEEKEETKEIDDEKVKDFAKNFVSKIMDLIHIKADIQVEVVNNEVYIDLENINDKDIGVAIGRKAETLNSLQYITGIALNKNMGKYFKLFINISGYRERRRKQIEEIAIKRAKAVIARKKSSALNPMNSYERKVVHSTLQNMDKIETVSEGKEPFRKVIIKYVK